MKIASLHPLLTEMAIALGGEQVEVVNLFPEKGDLHAFTPTMRELGAAADARLLLACGKGVEPYLTDLRDSVRAETKIIEVGTSLPNVQVPGTPYNDPHWWNTPENMKRAARTLLVAMQQAAPEHAQTFNNGYAQYAADMNKLTRTARLKLSRIPRDARYLVTGHAAMCHFCAAFNLTPIAIQGVARESQGDPATLAALLTELRQKKVSCIFTDVSSTPRELQVIAEELNIPTAPLFMDGINPSAQSYKDIFLHNINTISKHLGK